MLFKTSADGKWQEEDADITDGTFNGFASKQSAIEVIIPSKDASGNNVTSIGYHAFHGCSSLTSVTIPDSVESIGEYAFHGCGGLTNVSIPANVSYIGDYAFYNCGGLISMTIPARVISIGYRAFYGCIGLMSVTIPNSGLTSIGNYAFYGCYYLTSVTIGNGVTEIGEFAFYDCSDLSEMSMLGFTCNQVKANTYNWGIAVPAKQLVTIQCSDGYVILNDKS